MIQLFFKVPASYLPEEFPELETPGVVEENLFDLPVYFIVNGHNLLRHPVIETSTLPLIGFQSWALKALKRLKPGPVESISLTGAGMMHFQEIDGKVRVSTTRQVEGEKLDKAEVLAVFEQFAQDVKIFIDSMAPSMRRHPQWLYWFPADATSQLNLRHTR